ncbi:MAG TPA: glutamate-cysteine ligase family protein [Acidimicrobiales bacterium]|nr:glutamate-cysteine ligase family protein [Acidimicrobiales bacterium]
MPSAVPRMTPADARHIVDSACFGGAADGRVGLECELLVYAAADPLAPPDPAAVGQALAGVHLPAGSTVTFEPGGQLELSTAPLADVGAACRAMAADTATVEAALADVGLVLAGIGLDPLRSPQRVVTAPRYDAMEAFFDLDGDAGRRMMCSTSSLQVNLDTGTGDDVEARWALAHAVSPVLAAAFANSAVAGGRPTGHRSARLSTWWEIDPTRTAPTKPCTRAGWVEYAMRARVMLVRLDDDRCTAVREHLTFDDWVRHGHRLGHPTVDDLLYHLTTLFPPVRPRGRLELRVIDALPSPWWAVAAAVATALLDDERAAAVAREATARTLGLWREAGESALAHPLLADAARRCFAAALDALPRVGADEPTITATARFVEQYVARGRCPADDQLDAWQSAPSRSAPWS